MSEVIQKMCMDAERKLRHSINTRAGIAAKRVAEGFDKARLELAARWNRQDGIYAADGRYARGRHDG